MADNTNSDSQSPFTAGVTPETLEEILQRIDENLATRSLLHDKSDATGDSKPDNNAELFHLPLPPAPPNFFERIIEIRNAQAPYYVVNGNPIAKLIKKAHNLVIKVFGRKQAYFNNLTLNVLEALAVYVSALQEHNKSQSVLTNALSRQMTLKIEQFAAMQVDYQQLVAEIGQLAAKQNDEQQQATSRIEQLAAKQNDEQQQATSRIEQLAAKQNDEQQQAASRIEQLAAKQNDEQQQFESVYKELKGLSAWLDLVARKTEMVSMNVREALASQPQKMTEWPEPRIVDPEKYAQRLSEMKDQVKINLGCGEKPLPDYLNVDFRQLPDMDIVADVHRLPFDPGTVFEISSAHLVEHFREHHSRIILFPYWKSLLKPDGQLRIVCPNWAAMLEQMNAGHMSLEIFKRLTFGAQDYDGDDHFAMYTPETLEKLLLEIGFSHVEKIVVDRMNGVCPEMELLARL